MFHRLFSCPNDDSKTMEICIAMKKCFLFTQLFFFLSHYNSLYSCSRCFINSGSSSTIHPYLTKHLSAYLHYTCYKRTSPSSHARNRRRPRRTYSLALELTRGSRGITVSAAAACPGFQPQCHSKIHSWMNKDGMRGARAHLRHSVCSALVKSVSFVRIAAISSRSVLGGWSNAGAVLALGMGPVGCF